MDSRASLRIKKMVKKTHIYAFLTIVLLLFTAYFSFTRYKELRKIQGFISSGETALAQIEIRNSKVSGAYDAEKETYFGKITERIEQINAVYPEKEEFHKLTRQLEEYFFKHNVGNERMFLQSIDFGKATTPKVDGQEADYVVLPVSVSFESSRKNFFDFLKFVENSGTFEKKDRLMSLESISFSLPQVNRNAPTGSQSSSLSSSSSSKPADDTLKLTMKINAYFQKF